jgi:YgiT-type zinc finger domain-containing protein
MRENEPKTRCPSCGGLSVRRVRRNVRTKVGDEEITVRQVVIEECYDCGERLYDLDALRALRAAREKHKQTSAA